VFGDVAGRFVRRVDSELVAETDARLLVLPAAHVEHLLGTEDERFERLRVRLAALVSARSAE